MFKLFRKRLEIDAVAADIAEDFLDTQVRSTFELLDKMNYKHNSVERAEETFAFVYIITILGINLSELNQTEKENLSVESRIFGCKNTFGQFGRLFHS